MDSITWSRDGLEVGRDSTIFTITQEIIDPLSATYQHVLFIRDQSNLVGSFTCRVEDVSGNMDEKTLVINGICTKLCS